MSVVVLHPNLGEEQVVTVPHDQFQACSPDVVVSAGEFAYAPTEQAADPEGSEESCGVPLAVPQVSAGATLICS